MVAMVRPAVDAVVLRELGPLRGKVGLRRQVWAVLPHTVAPRSDVRAT